MAKRATKQKEDPVDTGTPGNFYFNHPICTNIASMKPRNKVYTGPADDDDYEERVLAQRREPVNLESYRNHTNCRLISSRNGMAHNPPKEVAYLLTQHPNQDEAKEYLDLAAQEGFGEGAIVVRRWGPLHQYRMPNSWGTLVLVHKTVRGSVAPWNPFSIKWHQVGEIEGAWAEDLIVIHAALSDDILDTIVEAQGGKV